MNIYIIERFKKNMQRYRLYKKYDCIDLGIYLYEGKKSLLSAFWSNEIGEWYLSCSNWNNIKNEMGEHWGESEIIETFHSYNALWDYIEEYFKEE